MYIVIFCSLVALLLTYFASVNKLRDGMLYGFILITTIAAIHYDYGSDYMGYYYDYLDSNANNYSFSQIIFGKLGMKGDYGWFILYKIFSIAGDRGFFILVAVLSIIQNLIFYRFIKAKVPKIWWPMAVLIYLFSTSLFLMNFSMLRQGFAISLFVLAYHFIENKKIWFSAAILIVAITIHKSSVILFPFIFWGFLPVKKSSIYVTIYTIFFMALFFNKNVLNNLFLLLIKNEDLAFYAENYQNNVNEVHYGLGFVINLIPFIASLIYLINKEHDESNKRIVMLSLLGTMVIPFGGIISLSIRIAFYFNAISIVAMPIVYRAVRNRTLRYSMVFIYVFMTLWTYWEFFQNPLWISFRVFHTIFDVI